MNQRTLTIAGIMMVGLAFIAANTFFIVRQAEQALVLQFGRPERVIRDPGLQMKTPFFENVEYYDKRLLDFNADPKEVIAADQKRLVVDAFVRYRITDPLRFKQTVADERTMRSRLNAILESSLRQSVGTVPLAEAISGKRAYIMREVKNLVNAQAQGAQLDEKGNLLPGADTRGFGIEVIDVRIMRADLPPENSETIYKRMQTSFEREAKQFRAQGAEDAQKIKSQAEKDRTILLAEARKKAEIVRGEGDGEALSTFAAATNQDPDFYQFYRTMQAYRKTLSQSDTTLILSPDSDFLKYIGKGTGRSE